MHSNHKFEWLSYLIKSWLLPNTDNSLMPQRLIHLSTKHSLLATLSRFNLPQITSHQPQRTPSREDMLQYFSLRLPKKSLSTPSMKTSSTSKPSMPTANLSSFSPKTLVSEPRRSKHLTRLCAVSDLLTH